MNFQEVAQVLQEIEHIHSRNQIMELLASLFHKATPEQAQMITYLSLGQVRPTYLGSQFNIAEKTIKKVIQTILRLPEDDFNQQVKQYGDLGTLLASHPQVTTQDPLSLEHVFQQLVELQTISGEGSQEERAQFLEKLLKNVTAAEGGFIVRIILGKLRTGFSDMTMIDAFSWMLAGNKSLRKEIEHAYNICADLGLIAFTLKKKGKDGLADIHITLGIPILPSLAERLPTAAEIVEKLGHCAAQPKLDGFRLQVHISTSQVWFYSRNLINMTLMFPELTQAAERLNITDAIFEGEAIVFDESTGAFLPFQETVKRKRKHDIHEMAQEFPLKLFVFDLLYLNGESMLDKGHEARRKAALTFLSADHHDTISLIDEREITTADQLEDYFLECMHEGLEGLVVKKMHAHYQPGKRNFNWIKLKRTQEAGTLTDTIDAVVLGYYHGRGRRATLGIGAFLIGVYDKKNDRYETLAKVGTGLSDQRFKDIKALCDGYKVDHKPFNVVCPKELYPDVWVEPSLVWVVIADEITRSPLHTAGKTEHELGYALRFPRALEQRFDKSADQATTVDEIKHMFENSYLKKAESKNK
jgi:DNA ligase-1